MSRLETSEDAEIRLVLFRHGPAEVRNPRRWPDDTKRPLSKDGVEATRRAAQGLASLQIPFGAVITSPAVRARRTAEIVGEALGIRRALLRWNELLPGESPAPVLQRISRLSDRSGLSILVGHEPTLGEVVGLALTGEAVSVVRLSKAGAALLSFPGSVVPGGGVIEWLLTRGQLAGLRS